MTPSTRMARKIVSAAPVSIEIASHPHGRGIVKAPLIGILAICVATICGGCRFASNGQNSVGAQLYEQGQYTAALQHFQKALDNDPTDPDSYYNMAASKHRLGVQRGDSQLISEAEALYNQCLDFAPDHVECHRGLAVLLSDTGRPDKAFLLMKNWAAENPQFAEPRVELARLYEEANDPQQALKNLEDAVQIDGNNARAWLALGQLRHKQGDLIQAKSNYEMSLALNNQSASERIAAINREITARNNAAISTGTQIAAPASFQSGIIRR